MFSFFSFKVLNWFNFSVKDSSDKELDEKIKTYLDMKFAAAAAPAPAPAVEEKKEDVK